MRIDRLLWFLRLVKTRSAAQTLVATGILRLNGKRIESAHRVVAVGDILTLPLARGVTAVEIIALPHRRGPAPEARACYRMLDDLGDNPIAAALSPTAEGAAAEGTSPP